MRSVPLLAGLALTALFGLAAAASAEDYDAAVEVETDARAGHGDSSLFYATNHLKVGDRVRVTQDMGDGWLAILPPSGSFSWVNKATVEVHVDKQPAYVTVTAPEAPFRIGSNVWTGPPAIVAHGKKPDRLFTSSPTPAKSRTRKGRGCPWNRRPARCAISGTRQSASRRPRR